MKAFRYGLLFAFVVLTMTTVAGAFCESLWAPAFEGYLTARTAMQEGDIVLVRIDASSTLSFAASTNDSKSITFEFTGGEFGNLFSFLPAARTGGTLSTRGSQEYALQTEIAARVTQIDEAGKALVQGSRGLSLENKEELLTVSGWIDPGVLGSQRAVSFSQLADARLSFRTFLEPAAATLTAADIERVIQQIQAAPAAEGAVPPAPGPQPAAGAAATAAPQAPVTQERATYQLSDRKKMELFLIYINRLVDVLF